MSFTLLANLTRFYITPDGALHVKPPKVHLKHLASLTYPNMTTVSLYHDVLGLEKSWYSTLKMTHMEPILAYHATRCVFENQGSRAYLVMMVWYNLESLTNSKYILGWLYGSLGSLCIVLATTKWRIKSLEGIWGVIKAFWTPVSNKFQLKWLAILIQLGWYTHLYTHVIRWWTPR